MSQKTESNGWDRTELNLKLSKRRRDLMAELAKRLAPAATPTEVIDYALSQAPAAEGDAGADERFADLEDAIERATNPIYREVADIVVDTAHKSATMLVNLISMQIDMSGSSPQDAK